MLEQMSNVNVTKYAVQVKNLEKTYKQSRKINFTVFQGVNLNLPEGTIYGLLGPSGCGKTSLLKCILGRLKVTRGTITIFGKPSGNIDCGVPGPNVGYMPQETTMFEMLTISECMRYYGTIVGLSREKINEAVDFFVELLNLPSKNTINGQLSGGQLRRVAFAVSLIHMPKLLILDEPTVGIDCITKKKMWDYLAKVVKETGASIILTTHYIEEARGAHMVGMMHNHMLAEEDYTERLLSKYNCLTLEEVFLIICSDQWRSCDDVNSNKGSNDVWVQIKSCDSDVNEPEPEPEDNRLDTGKDSPVDNDSMDDTSKWTMYFLELRIRWYILFAIVQKNCINLYRFPGALLLILILPFSQVMTVVFLTTGRVTDLKLLVINEDSGPLGNQYLSYLDTTIFLQVIGNNSEDRMKLISDGEVFGSVVIAPNFTESLSKRVSHTVLVDRETVASGTINVTLSNLNMLLNLAVHSRIMNGFAKFYQSLHANSLEGNSRTGSPYIMIDDDTLNFLNGNDFVIVISGSMTLSVFFGSVGVAILSLYMERTGGLLERTYVAGVSSAEVILGFMFLLLLILVPQIILVLISYYFVYVLSFGTACAVFVILYAVGVCGIALGMCLSMTVDHTTAILLLLGLLITLTTAVTGHMWPIEAVPYFIRPIYMMMPYAYPARAINTSIMHGFSIYKKEVIRCFCVLLGNTALFMFLTLLFFKLRR